MRAYPPATAGVLAAGDSIGVDEYREVAFAVTRNGAVALAALDGNGKRSLPPVTAPSLGTATVTTVSAPAKGGYLLGTSDGRVIPLEVKFDVTFPNGERTVTPRPEFGAAASLDPERKRAIVRLGHASTASGPLTVAQVGPTELLVHKVIEKKALIGGARKEETSAALTIPLDGEVTALRLDSRGEDLFIGTSRGQIVWYDPREGTALVISPLIALMHDQIRSANAIGLRAASVTSADADREATVERFKSGALDLLYVAPERATGEARSRPGRSYRPAARGGSRSSIGSKVTAGPSSPSTPRSATRASPPPTREARSTSTTGRPVRRCCR